MKKVLIFVFTVLLLWACDSSEKKEKIQNQDKPNTSTTDTDAAQEDKPQRPTLGVRDMPPAEIPLESLVPNRVIMEILEVPEEGMIKRSTNEAGELVFTFPNLETVGAEAIFKVSKGEEFKGGMDDVQAAGTGDNKTFFDGIGELGGYFEGAENKAFHFPLNGYWYKLTLPDHLPEGLDAEKGRLIALRLWEIHHQ